MGCVSSNGNRRSRRMGGLGLLIALASTAFGDDATREKMAKVNVVLPGAAERELALSAAPEPLRAGATVYVFGKNGFEKARAGSNGFTCLVNRDAFIYGASHLKPTCWDAAGATTYVPVMLKLGELLARGASADAIRAAIDAGFADHTFNPPRTGGVAYMLAGDVEVDASTGEVTRQLFPGHFMFYVNGVTNEQLGYVAGATHAQNLPHVFSDGAGGNHGLAYVIVVAAKPEQDGASKAADRMRH